MCGGPESRCVGRVSGLEGTVLHQVDISLCSMMKMHGQTTLNLLSYCMTDEQKIMSLGSNYNKKITCPSHQYPHVIYPFNEIQGWYWFALICTNLNYT